METTLENADTLAILDVSLSYNHSFLACAISERLNGLRSRIAYC